VSAWVYAGHTSLLQALKILASKKQTAAMMNNFFIFITIITSNLCFLPFEAKIGYF